MTIHSPALTRNYALPATALSIPLIPISVLLPSFYAEDLGIGFAATGAVLLIARLSDILTDPLIGIWSDQSRSRFGRRKPFVLGGSVLAIIGLFALGLPSSTASAGYLLVWSVVLYLGWTLFAVPYYALAAELVDDVDARTTLTGVREICGIIGILIAVSVPVAAAGLGIASTNPVFMVALTTVVIGVPTIGLFLFRVNERPPATTDVTRTISLNPFVEQSPFRTNPHFRQLLATWFVNSLANGLPAALMPIYANYVLGVTGNARYQFLFVFVAASLLFLPMWIKLAARFGKHTTWRLAMTINCLVFLPAAALGPGDTLFYFAICLTAGACLGADLCLPPSMQADVLDYDRLTSQRDRAALLFGWWSMSSKLATALAIGIGFIALGVGANDTAQDAPSTLLVVGLYCVIPVALKIVAIAMLKGFPLTREEVEGIQGRLAATT